MEFDDKWIIQPNGFNEKAIDWAKEFGEKLAIKSETQNELSTSQLRKFFGLLKKVQAEGYSEKNKVQLLMLKAQLAYAKGRDWDIKNKKYKSKLEFFVKKIDNVIDLVLKATIIKSDDKTKDTGFTRFKNFVYLMEAIVAYHKANGGE